VATKEASDEKIGPDSEKDELFIINKHRVPPGGYYFITETGFKIENSGLDGLKTKVAHYYEQNGIKKSPKEVDRSVENQVCERIPSEFCQGPPSAARKAKTFSEAMIKFAMSGFETVDEETYNQRFETCDSCEHYGPNGLFGLANCRLCGCYGLKLFLPSQTCPADKW